MELDYKEFIQSKLDLGSDTGFTPISIPDFLFDFQVFITEQAIKKGRMAIFADCGMGKTPIQLVWADNMVRKNNKPVLILTPLAVSKQTLSEANKFDIEAYPALDAPNGANIQVVNYEKLHHFNSSDYCAVVCDESSILKNFNGVRKAQITEFMRQVPYRLLCTATAAPNDWPEIGTSSEALGYMGYMDMVSKFFTSKNKALSSRQSRHGRDKLILREYSKDYFWRWITSWAKVGRSPSDFGFANDKFILPELIENDIEVEARRSPNGMLPGFDMEAVNFFEEREAIRRTITERCEMSASKVAEHNISIVWCNLNDEAKLLRQIIPNSIEISGADSDEKKIEAVDWFVNGSETKRVLISKPKIFGFGMNFQHCHHCTYFPTHSYEQYYQATRRIWRFGQAEPVTVDRIFTNGGRRILKNLNHKSTMASQMFDDLIKHMNEAVSIENTYQERDISVPKWMN